MKRVSEKVKDIVEICPFTHLNDFAADPGLTLSGYHFTDITADLMVKWIDRIAAVRSGHGNASALAGFRGVGKSHFISVLSAIIARPELRSKISDSHVASSAERLSRRHGNVAFVRRGSGTSLIDELKRAVAPILGTNSNELNDSLYDLLLRVSDQCGDTPLVILIDTAFGRDTRVSRDDGAMLSEIAEAAKAIGVFVGVALDDDISGADGPNASISRSFSIDYLDQEHLYKIVESVIFSKHNHMRGVLHEIYDDYRQQMPGFRWSEQRFTSLYPLHPATVEIAPLIRLHIHDFALLGFAAEAGVKILGRPANSLIGLDEVFDSVEQKLRAVPELQDAFYAFDQLEREVVGKTPVLFRHPAKLILKGLLMLSLSGQGTAADEIAASMMIVGAGSADTPGLNVDGLLSSFVDALPNAVDRSHLEGGAVKYRLKIGSTVDLEAILSAAIAEVSSGQVWKSLVAQAAEKWVDFDGADGTILCNIEWRGGIRPGELVWPPSETDNGTRDRKEMPDWTVTIEPESDQPRKDADATAVWKIAKLTDDETNAIKLHCVLQNEPEIRAHYGESLATALHVSSVALEKAWNRIFFRDAVLAVGAFPHKFSEESHSAHSLSEILSAALAPVFDSLYPEHPVFKETLGFKQAAELVATFLSGSGAAISESQRLAESFAVPLQLAERVGEIIVPTSGERLAEHAMIKTAFSGLSQEGPIELKDIAVALSAAPYGLTRDAQHVVLGALVAQKVYEFVTSNGNRINYRSLDLQIIWDDIVGLAKPLNEQYSASRLLIWARLITGNAALKSIDRNEDRELIIDSLGGWLTGWNQSKVLSDFDALPDDDLNAGIWRTAANLRKSFGAMAEIIDSLKKKDLSLDQCLQLIADLFSDSESEYEAKKIDLRVLRDFTAGVRMRGDIRTYLTLCENTSDDVLENSKISLINAIEVGSFNAVNAAGDQFIEVWTHFKELYKAYYTQRHDQVMKTNLSGEGLKAIIRSEAWSTFEGLSLVSWFDSSYLERARTLIREMRQLHCSSDVNASLNTRPFCGCSFSLAETERLLQLPDELKATVVDGIKAFRSACGQNERTLLNSAESDAMRASLSKILTAMSTDKVPVLSGQDIRILKLAAEALNSSEFSIECEAKESDLSEAKDREEFWESEVQKVEAFVNTEA